ncbi:uncharacterized protein PV06_07858 [Exophiala oligosperma]|uniref:Heterokaryon incompatibility domain-containing protein n=1 Tax=Exophiala oligosperma TaxID=215243 RepID=A0A0D2AKY0_9EURO|nr:uncharacterized protein PV06_07858 [Exophiala oligosperma]KIW40681.1 hypothetical protein PV06_07858 [Exophiala oligosperma]
MALCTTCNSFDLYQIFNYPDVGLPTNVVLDRQYFWDEHLDSLCFRHSDNISQIQAAASAGCGLCTLLFDAFKRKEPGAAQLAGDLPIILTQGKTIEDYKNDPPHFSPYLEPKLRSFFASPEEGPISLCDLDISIDYNSVNIPSNLPFEPLSKLYPHSKDPGCVALASRWLTSCLENHACPAPNLTGPRSLIRFLHVGSESRNPHLVEFPPRVSLRPWIALSYRWGDREPPLKLMKRTEKLLKDGVEISALDATIQDAIIISRGLGIQYLWVDALCIFQDQESDWLEQSSQMSFIYGQSTVTIASVDTDDASQSFLRQRETQYVGISWKEETNQVASDECRNPPQVYVSHSWPDRNDQLTGPWSKRAWTLQEGLLPNRILFYSSHHIAWKCCSMVRYERAVQHVPMTEFVLSIVDEPGGRPFWTFDLFTKFKLLPKYLENPECHSLHDRYRIWYDIVEDYSARCVKYRRDRLVAISGIARMYGATLQSDRYVAGLWQSDMLPGLLWYAKGLELFGNKLDQSTHDVEVEAPSWSWANAPCGYTIRNDWTNKSLRSLAALEDVSFDLVESSNPFGGVLHAQVTIRGPVCRFSRLYHPTWRSASSNLSAFERHLSRVVELDYGQRANEFSGEGCYAALLLVQEFPSIDCRVDALILRRSQSRKDERGTVFERLGVLRLSFYSIPTSPSFLSRRIGPQEQSLDHRLNSRGGVRRSKRIFCREVFQEYKRSRWPRESVRIV